MERTMQQWQRQIEDALLLAIDHIPNCHPRLQEAMRYACASGGKRVRPILVLASSQMGAAAITDVLPVAVAIEMVHTYSLIHDDLPGMDNDDYRRGQLTVHKQFDEATAILAGDALLTAAFEQLLSAPLPAEKVVDAVRILSRASGASGMISGQMRDIVSEHQMISLEELKHIHQDKTGQLLEAAVSLGLLFVEEKAVDYSLTRFSRHFGLAFQIQNDLQDVLWNPQQTGKMTGKDADLDKNTYPSLLGVDKARHQLDLELSQALQAVNELPVQNERQQAVHDILETVVHYLDL